MHTDILSWQKKLTGSLTNDSVIGGESISIVAFPTSPAEMMTLPTSRKLVSLRMNRASLRYTAFVMRVEVFGGRLIKMLDGRAIDAVASDAVASALSLKSKFLSSIFCIPLDLGSITTLNVWPSNSLVVTS